MKSTAIFATSAVLFTSLFVWSPAGPCGINFIVLVPALGFWIATVYAVSEERRYRRAQFAALEQTLRLHEWQHPVTLPGDVLAENAALETATPRDNSALRA